MAEQDEETVRVCCMCGAPATFRIAMQVTQRIDDALDMRGKMLCWCMWFFCRSCAFEKQIIEWEPLKGKPLSEGQIALLAARRTTHTGNA